MSKLRFIYAPMESGKSALLLIEARNFEKRNIGVICMKPSVDNRESVETISSRIGISRECLVIYPNYDLYEIIKNIVAEQNENNGLKLQWVLIDESQFLTARQVEQLRCAVDDFGVDVKCYGLRTDFMTQLFEGSKRLMELSDDIEEMKIACECGKKAIFNVRFNENGEVVTNGEQILIGGEDIYKPMCSKCYKKLLMNKM